MSRVSARSSSRRSAAISSPPSAASEYQMAAVARFRGTPSPRSCMAPSAAAAAPRPWSAAASQSAIARRASPSSSNNRPARYWPYASPCLAAFKKAASAPAGSRRTPRQPSNFSKPRRTFARGLPSFAARRKSLAASRESLARPRRPCWCIHASISMAKGESASTCASKRSLQTTGSFTKSSRQSGHVNRESLCARRRQSWRHVRQIAVAQQTSAVVGSTPSNVLRHAGHSPSSAR
mmetsp:Transcript_17313/g.49444  ORF Transcript_17313/g.49444 Transcript_17313/m.49444 type:complete len:236 (+) Transcript_17313:63-770(+)